MDGVTARRWSCGLKTEKELGGSDDYCLWNYLQYATYLQP